MEYVNSKEQFWNIAGYLGIAVYVVKIYHNTVGNLEGKLLSEGQVKPRRAPYF